MKRKRLESEDSDSDESTPIKRIDNHIYFYTGVSNTSVLELVSHIRDLNRECNDNPRPIFLHINSEGGDLFAGLAAAEHIQSSKCPVIAIVEGQAASAATIMVIVAKKRVITPLSYMLIHEIRSGIWGSTSEIRQEFDNCKKMTESLVNLYNTFTKLNKSEIQKILQTDNYWSAKECKSRGLIDKIESPWVTYP